MSNQQEPKATPFSNGSEYRWFTGRNCDRCVKGYNHETQEASCDIEEALSEASLLDDTIPAEKFARMGGHSGKCTEFVRAGDLMTVEADGETARHADLPGQARLF